MSELRDLSKLPAEQAYWDRLEGRIIGQRGSGAAGRRGGDRSGWWTPLATRALGLGGLAVAAGIAALLLVPPRARDGATNPAGLLRLPDDPGMIAFLSAPKPPSLGSLMIGLLRSKP
jgi:hypothetical protein